MVSFERFKPKSPGDKRDQLIAFLVFVLFLVLVLVLAIGRMERPVQEPPATVPSPVAPLESR